jgi:hypothetical protein
MSTGLCVPALPIEVRLAGKNASAGNSRAAASTAGVLSWPAMSSDGAEVTRRGGRATSVASSVATTRGEADWMSGGAAPGSETEAKGSGSASAAFCPSADSCEGSPAVLDSGAGSDGPGSGSGGGAS